MRLLQYCTTPNEPAIHVLAHYNERNKAAEKVRDRAAALPVTGTRRDKPEDVKRYDDLIERYNDLCCEAYDMIKDIRIHDVSPLTNR